MSETDPVAYLRNAHQRAEELAKAATPGPWRAEEHAEHGFRVGTADDRSWVAWTGEFDDEPESSRPDSVFIAANSPDKALARVQAERGVLDEHAVHECGDREWCALEPRHERAFCNACRPGTLYPCRTLLALASGWGWTEDLAAS